MTQRIPQFGRSLIAGLTVMLTLFCTQLAVRAGDDRYIVTLKPVAVVTDEIVRLGDIAEIEGASDVVIEALQGLDLQDAPTAGATVTISRSQVDIRLKLAKAPAGRIIVTGERTVVGLSRKVAKAPLTASKLGTEKTSNTIRQVSALKAAAAEVAEKPTLKRVAAASPTNRMEVVEVAKQAVLNRLPWDPRDIEIDATYVGARANDLHEDQLGHLSAELKSAWPPLGRVQVIVTAPGEGLADASIPVVLSVKYFQNTVIAKRAIEMGRTIQDGDVYVDRREVRELGVQIQELGDVLGRVSIRPIPALQPVRVGDVKAVQTVAAPVASKVVDKTPVIRRGDTVQLVAFGGPLAISVTAKSLQDGAVGDVIRLENVDSKKAISGKVVGKGQVEVQY